VLNIWAAIWKTYRFCQERKLCLKIILKVFFLLLIKSLDKSSVIGAKQDLQITLEELLDLRRKHPGEW
jgi:hypothetical protein